MRQRDFKPGEQLISVVRKGTRAVQELPASADAFVWHRLYQQELLTMGVPRGRRQPAWWTLRRPYRPLTCHGAHRMFERVNASLGADWTPHDLRHSAASRMARDSELSLTDVQWVMGHAHLEMADTQRLVHSRGGQKKVDFYLRLHALGIFPADAPAAIRAFGVAQGQLTVEELVDRCRLQCKPVRDLLVDYLKERQPALDYASLQAISASLAG